MLTFNLQKWFDTIYEEAGGRDGDYGWFVTDFEISEAIKSIYEHPRDITNNQFYYYLIDLTLFIIVDSYTHIAGCKENYHYEYDILHSHLKQFRLALVKKIDDTKKNFPHKFSATEVHLSQQLQEFDCITEYFWNFKLDINPDFIVKNKITSENLEELLRKFEERFPDRTSEIYTEVIGYISDWYVSDPPVALPTEQNNIFKSTVDSSDKNNSPSSSLAPVAISSIPEKTMSTVTPSSDVSVLFSAVKEGAKDGAASGLADTMTTAFMASPVGQRLHPLCHTATGRTIISYVLPVVIWAAATWMPDSIPKADVVAAVALRAVRGHTVRYVADGMKELTSFFTAMASLGNTVN